MYQKILVPLALNHGIASQTLAAARALCAEGGQLTALHVYEVPQGSVSAYLREDAIQYGPNRQASILFQTLDATIRL